MYYFYTLAESILARNLQVTLVDISDSISYVYSELASTWEFIENCPYDWRLLKNDLLSQFSIYFNDAR